MISKYFKTKNSVLILVGLTWIAMSTWAISIVAYFILYVFFNVVISYEVFFLLDIGFILPGLICWVLAMSKLLHLKLLKRKITLRVFIITIGITEIILLYFIFSDPTTIGYNMGFNTEFTPFSIFIYSLTSLIFLTMGILFVKQSLDSNDKETNVKGKILFLAFIFFIIGAFITMLIREFLIETIGQFLLLMSSIFFYLGFILPNWMKKYLNIKDNYSEMEYSVEKIDDVRDFLKILGNRRRVNEEEVTFFREKKICLVCKGKVEGFSFICKCDALYCQKCALAMGDLDNACWACNGPIDKSKPVKPYNVEEDIDLQDDLEPKN